MQTPAHKGAALLVALSIAVPVVQKAEGLALDPYWDIAHVRTYCYGETQNVVERHYTPAECVTRLRKRLGEYGSAVQACLPAVATNVYMLAAFTSFAYNVGKAGACGSTAFRLAREGKFAQACDALRMWNKAGGKVRKGLVTRRENERAVCLIGANHVV